MSEKPEPLEPKRLGAKEIVAEWQSKGIESLEDLAARAAEATPDADETSRLPIDVDKAFPETPTELARTLTHRPTKYPVVVDGSETTDLSQ
jgi:hypothetical protein